MSTLISQLPEEIRKKAEHNRRHCRDAGFNPYTDILFDAFNWSDTPEGPEYWEEISRDQIRSKLEAIIDRRLSRNETIDLLVKLWEESK